MFCFKVSDRLHYPRVYSTESLQPRHKQREREREGEMGLFLTGLRQVRLTQALAHSHAVLLWVEIVAVAGTAPVYEAHTLPLTHVEVPAGHGGTAGASFSLQGAHRCQGDSLLDHPATSNRNYKHSEKKKKTTNKHSLLLLHLHILLHKTINILKRLLFVHCEQDLAAVWLQEKRRMICHHCSLRKLNSTSQCLLWAEEKAICWCIHLSNYSLAEI